MSYSVLVGLVGANKLLFIVISNMLKNVRIVAELRHSVARSFKSMQYKAHLPTSGDRVEQWFYFYLSDVILSQHDI